MTNQIYYMQENSNKTHVLFDIEYYLTKAKNLDKWFSEISCLPIVDGIAYFLRDKLNDEKFDFDEFLKDAYEIEELRGLLYEKYNNKPKGMEEAREFHYKKFGKLIREMFDEFSHKYGLYINID